MALFVNRCRVVTRMRWDGAYGWVSEYGDDHASCSGSHTTPGVLGGWVCSCECHRLSSPESTEPGAPE